MRKLLIMMLTVGWASCGLPQCRNYAAQQYNSVAGFYVVFQNQAASGDTLCRLQNLSLIFGIDTPAGQPHIRQTGGWQLNTEYTAVDSTSSNGTFSMTLNDVLVGSTAGTFVPLVAPLKGNIIPSYAARPAEYVVIVDDVQVQGSVRAHAHLSFAPEANRSAPLFEFDPSGPRQTSLNLAPGETFTVTVKFHFIMMPGLAANAPYVDRYGQSIYGNWKSKITDDNQLVQNAAEAHARFRERDVPRQFDQYGGLITRAWRANATGYYRVEQKNGYWWLISPLGNPVFYTAFATAADINDDGTPVTGREYMFQELPPTTGDYANAWRTAIWGDSGISYVSFQAANLIRKYGSTWQQDAVDVTLQRVKVWGFSGLGKFCKPIGIQQLPGLHLNITPNTPGMSHPDFFDSNVLATFKRDIGSQISPRLTDPLVVGWALGNESQDGPVTSSEISGLFSHAGASTAAKQNLVNYALANIYNNDLSSLATAWHISASTVQEVYASTASKLPVADTETLRQYFENQYYKTVYTTVKQLDPNHLFFGSWFLEPNFSDIDWGILAKYVDVIGYDRYLIGLTDAHFESLLESTGKPAMLGEFAFPPTYRMQRGFGAFNNSYSDDDEAAGMLYAQTLGEASSNKYIIGTDWFQYRDEPVTGRGPGSNSNLTEGERVAFGLVDIADTPKWRMVERMRQANLGVAPARLARTLLIH